MLEQTPWELYSPPVDLDLSHLVEVPWDLCYPGMWNEDLLTSS